jgi:hypothetical protein
MSELFWKLRYALIIRRRARLPLRFAWQCAGYGWDSNLDIPWTPSDAVDEELSCWGEWR